MTTTDNDLRDLLWRMGNSPGEIEAHMANPYTRTYLRVFIDEFNRRVAEVIARRIAEKLFPEWSNPIPSEYEVTEDGRIRLLSVADAGSCLRCDEIDPWEKQ